MKSQHRSKARPIRTWNSALLLALCTIGAARAADDPSNTEAQRSDERLEEVVVTALKRGENLQDTAASISAVSGEALMDRGLVNLADLSKAVPNLNWGEHFGTTMITIRGVGSTVDSGITEPTVAMYVDGVFIPRSTMSTLRAVDLQRVEVLRGPQGTLYGRNATGGAINFVSAAPSDELEGAVNLSAGSRSGWGASGYISGPVSDTVKFRLSGGHEEQDGYVKVRPSGRELGGTDVDYVRGALRIEPTDSLSFDLAVRHEQSSSPNAWQQLLTPTVLPTPGQTTEHDRIIADQPFNQDTHTTVASAAANWDIAQGLTFRSISSYVDHDSSIDVDADATDLDGFNTIDFSRPSESYGQEFNLLRETDKVKWILGAYYFHEDATTRLPLRLGSVFAPAFGVPVESKLIESGKSDTDTYAAFADLTYSLSDRLRLNLGLRYNHETKDFEQLSGLSIPGVGFVPLAAAYANGAISTDTKSNKVLPKVAVQFDLTDDISTYAQWSKGFKSGGQNLEGGTGATIGEDGLYHSESISAYEIGLKSRWLDHALTANFATFYYDYSDLQVTITVPPTTSLVQNADAKIYGLESEFDWQATSQLRLNLAATLTHARFDGFVAFDDANPGAGLQNLDGEPLPHAPDYTVNAGVEYSIPLSTAWFSDLSLRADATYTDDVVLRYFGTANDTQDSYLLGSVSAKLGGASDKTTVRLFVNNIGDKEYLQNVSYIGAIGAYVGNYGQPRTWGLQLTRKFF